MVYFKTGWEKQTIIFMILDTTVRRKTKFFTTWEEIHLVVLVVILQH